MVFREQSLVTEVFELRVMENSFYWRPPIILIGIIASSALTLWLQVTTPNPR